MRNKITMYLSKLVRYVRFVVHDNKTLMRMSLAPCDFFFLFSLVLFICLFAFIFVFLHWNLSFWPFFKPQQAILLKPAGGLQSRAI